MQERLQEIVKRDGGLVALAKVLIEDQSAHGITEAEFRAAVTDYAKGLHPNATPDAAFVKVFSDSGAYGVAIRKAHALTKLSPFEPTMVGGVAPIHEAIDNTEQSEAYAQLVSMAEKMRAAAPKLSAAQAFDKVFTDPKKCQACGKSARQTKPDDVFPDAAVK